MRSLLIGLFLSVATIATADPRDWAKRIPCELQTAGVASLPTLEVLQGSSPLIACDQYRSGKALTVTNDVQAVMRFSSSLTNTLWVSVTNQSYFSNSYLIQLPSLGTNAVNWVYTILYYKDSAIYWTGTGRLDIKRTDVTGNALVWQQVAGCITTADVNTAISTHNLAHVSHPDKLSSTNASFLETVSLASTAWQNPASATNWTWISDGTQITLTGYTGPNDVVIPDYLDNLPVTGFGTVFSPLTFGTDITSVSGGNNINRIEANAFVDCNSLKNVALRNVSFVGGGAFGLTPITNMLFSVSAPPEGANVFQFVTPASVNITVDNPIATGWGTTWNGMPVVRMDMYGNVIGNATTATTVTGVQSNQLANTMSGEEITNLVAQAASTTFNVNLTTNKLLGFTFSPTNATYDGLCEGSPQAQASVSVPIGTNGNYAFAWGCTNTTFTTVEGTFVTGEFFCSENEANDITAKIEIYRRDIATDTMAEWGDGGATSTVPAGATPQSVPFRVWVPDVQTNAFRIWARVKRVGGSATSGRLLIVGSGVGSVTHFSLGVPASVAIDAHNANVLAHPSHINATANAHPTNAITGLSSFMASAVTNGQLSVTLGTVSPTTLRVSDGSAGVPSISFANDTGTGFHRVGAYQIGVDFAGVEWFRLTQGTLYFFADAGAFAFGSSYDTILRRTAPKTFTVEDNLITKDTLTTSNLTASGISKIILPTSTNDLASGTVWDNNGGVEVAGKQAPVTFTNSTTLADGLYNGTNGVYFTRSGTNYWILLP